MGHTLPDYTTKYKLAKVFSSVDMNELAARLGSIDTFDRRGNVMFIEDFEATTVCWNMTAEDETGSVAIDDTTHRHGNQSIKIYPGTVAGKEADLENIFPVRQYGNIGIEFAFSYSAFIGVCDFRLWKYNGVNSYRGELRFDQVNNKLQYLNSGGTYTDLATNINLLASSLTFNIIKLVVDFTNFNYKRVICDETEYSVEDIPIYMTASSTYHQIFVCVRVTSVDMPFHGSVWVDDFILTENEP